MSSFAQIIALTEALNKYRALTTEEADWLEYALRKDGAGKGCGRKRGAEKNFWESDVPMLRRMLEDGKSPAQIAVKLRRTPRAVYRKMYKLGLRCGQGSVAANAATE